MAANVIVMAVLLALIALAIRKIVNDKKNGVGSCGYNCASCASHGSCHSSGNINGKVVKFEKKEVPGFEAFRPEAFKKRDAKV